MFDDNGNFRRGFCPYRTDEDDPRMAFLFDEGELKWDLRNELDKILNTNQYKWDCDMAKLRHASEFSSNTKGNYSTIYYWR